MFYLTTHSHILSTVIWCQACSRIILIEREIPLPPHRLLFSVNSKGYAQNVLSFNQIGLNMMFSAPHCI